jgi:putative inorganic carbon (hco3(-)) transporter
MASAAFNLKTSVRILFLVLVVSLGTMQPFVFVAGQRLAPTEFIFAAAALLFLLALLFGRLKFKWHRFYWFLAAYLAALLVSAVFSLDPKASFIKLIGVAYLLGLAVLAFNVIEDEKDIDATLRAWLIGSGISVAIGLLTILLFYVQRDNSLLNYTLYHYGAVPVGYYPRVSSTFVSASMFCNYLSVSLIMLLLARRSQLIGARVFWTLLVTIAVCAVFTISAGLGGVFFALGAWFWLVLRGPGKRYRGFAPVVLEFGFMFAMIFLALNFIALKDAGNGVLQPSSRVLVWSDALAAFTAYPVTGIGIGQPAAHVIYQNTDGTTSLLTDAHNIFLNIAAQCGVIGLAGLLALIFYILWLGLGRGSHSFVVKGLSIAFLSAFVYQGLTGSFEDARHLWVLIGLIPAAGSVFDSWPEQVE